MNLGDKLLLVGSGVVYFRAMLTSNRDFDIWKRIVGYGNPVGQRDVEYCNLNEKVQVLSHYSILV